MNYFLIVVAFLLILMNAFFVAAEFGMVKLRNTRIAAIKRMYGTRGKILSYIHQHLDAYLSACQLGITLASIGLGWVGEPAIAHFVEPLLKFIQMTSPDLIKFFAFFIAFLLISFLHIVIGELMPKSLAIRQSERVSIWTAVPLYGFYWVMYPAIWLLNTCSNFLLNKIGLSAVHRGETFYSTDEIKLILNTSRFHGELTTDEARILEHTLDFADLKVTEVMRPQEEMVVLESHLPINEALKMIAEHRYSRYPIYDKEKKEIVGIIHVKDIFATLYQQQPIEDLKTFIRPVLKVSQRLPAIDLLHKFQEGMPHFALVYKGQETLLGFVTLDNLLHVLIGRIKDEFHRTQDDWIINPDGNILVRGDCPIFSLERALNQDIDVSGYDPEPETLAALILNQLGRLPQEGERLTFKEFKAIVQKMRGSRIVKVKIIPKKKLNKT